MRDAGAKQAERSTACVCGRVCAGNAIGVHRRWCLAWQENAAGWYRRELARAAHPAGTARVLRSGLDKAETRVAQLAARVAKEA